MSGKRLLTHLTGWLGVFCFWLLITLDRHPTLSLAVIATSIIVGCSAAAVYLNTGFLLPRFEKLRWPAYVPAIFSVVMLLAVAAATSIQLAYDILWGPDPLRFGFWTNVALDGSGIMVHLLLAMLIIRPARSVGLRRE
jgi:hypothetical protein